MHLLAAFGRFGRVGLVRIRIEIGSVASGRAAAVVIAVAVAFLIGGFGFRRTAKIRRGVASAAARVALDIVGAETYDAEMTRPSIDSALRRVPIATEEPTDHPVFLAATQAKRICGFPHFGVDQQQFLSSSTVPTNSGPR